MPASSPPTITSGAAATTASTVTEGAGIVSAAKTLSPPQTSIACDMRWRPPIVCTVATEGEGVAELWSRILEHRAFLESDGGIDARRRARLAAELRALVVEQLLTQAGGVAQGERFDALVDRVAARTTDPYAAADELVAGGA